MADFVGSVACPSLPLGVSWHATVSTVHRFQGRADRPARHQERGRTMTEASVSFAGNLTDDPEVRYTEGGIANVALAK